VKGRAARAWNSLAREQFGRLVGAQLLQRVALGLSWAWGHRDRERVLPRSGARLEGRRERTGNAAGAGRF
jgi:hypothetical protein